MDRISSLPDNVIDAILKRLSIREVVRTSILSRAWRDQLSTVSQLVFDKETFPRSEDQQQKEYDNEVARIVDQVLLLHKGTIDMFKLSVDLSSYPDIDRWIRYLSRRGVAELILEIWKDSPYRLPSSFFSWKGITNLKLRRCIFRPPSSFNGFSRLTILDLEEVTTSDEELGHLGSVWICFLKFFSENSFLKVAQSRNVDGMPSEDVWPAQEEFNCNFNNLQIVKMTCFAGTTAELKFIELILANAPLLERMQIQFRKEVRDEAKILRQLLQLQRSSVKAKIVVP